MNIAFSSAKGTSFSLTKWIHLNGGDDALLRFFRRVYDVLTPRGSLVLEPQAWDTYAKAKRMDNVGLHLSLIVDDMFD